MIPGLLHGRVLGAAAGAGAIPPGYLPVAAYAEGAYEASATAAFSVRPDGTWASTATGAAAKAGSWYAPVGAGVGAGFQVRITPTLVAGQAGLRSNAAADWQALTEERAFSVTVQRFTTGQSSSTNSVLVEIRTTGGVVVSSQSFQLSAGVVVGSTGTGPGGNNDGEVPRDEL